MTRFNPSRRQFFRTGVIAGIAVWVAPYGSRTFAALFEDKVLSPIVWNAKTRSTGYRIDGISKVTGAKVFARDIRARDMPHWPREQAHAFLLRVTRADALYEGFDLSMLSDDLRPDRVVTAEDLVRDRIELPDFYGTDMLLASGKTPLYLGHPVALLIYRDFARYSFAKGKLKFRDDVIRYGAKTGHLKFDPYGSFRYVRVGGETPYAEDAFSSLKDTPIFPTYREHEPAWPSASTSGSPPERAMHYAGEIAAALASPPADWLVHTSDYFSQSIDTAALEPDNANGWYDPAQRAMHLVISSQSPAEVAQNAAKMLATSNFKADRLFVHPCYTVGYGSKDHSIFPFYGLLASLYGDGLPVRLANDRYEQFQSTMKRHSFAIHNTLAVDRKTGLFQVFRSSLKGDGGGRANFSASVALVAGTSGQSIYYLPRSDVDATAYYSRGVEAGSMRGYGTLQSMTATELMVDEVAEQLGMDAIELRLKNVFKTGMKNTQGAIPGGAFRIEEMLNKAIKHPLWTERAARKKTFDAANTGKRYGVGFACVQKDYGTGAEAGMAALDLNAEGRISLRHIGVEMGTGMATSQAVVCAKWLGRPADEIQTGVIDWPDLPLTTSGDPYMMAQAEQDLAALDPEWTPRIISGSSASNSSYYYSHPTREAARIIFVHCLWPAALSIWSEGFGGGQAAPYVVRREDARWTDSGLTANGLEALPLERLAKRAHEFGLVTGATVHSFNRWEWSYADFEIDGQSERLPLDGLALRYGAGASAAKKAAMGGVSGSHRIQRRNVAYPAMQRNNAGVVYYTPVAAIAAVAVHLASGKVEVLTHHSIMECGATIVPELVSGQLQGGVAMGIGHALHEFLPLYEGGPGDGTWNFNRYPVPRASDVAVWSQTVEVLPPLSDTDPAKGLAEVTMIPIVAAVMNAIAHAIGHRFREMPVSAEKIKEVLS